MCGYNDANIHLLLIDRVFEYLERDIHARLFVVLYTCTYTMFVIMF